MEGDHEGNKLYLGFEQEYIGLLALQQPVASDRRFIAASFKIITDLRRIGDLATNLGQYTLQAARPQSTDVGIQTIGEQTEQILADAWPHTRWATALPTGQSTSATTTSASCARPHQRRSRAH